MDFINKISSVQAQPTNENPSGPASDCSKAIAHAVLGQVADKSHALMTQLSQSLTSTDSSTPFDSSADDNLDADALFQKLHDLIANIDDDPIGQSVDPTQDPGRPEKLNEYIELITLQIAIAKNPQAQAMAAQLPSLPDLDNQIISSLIKVTLAETSSSDPAGKRAAQTQAMINQLYQSLSADGVAQTPDIQQFKIALEPYYGNPPDPSNSVNPLGYLGQFFVTNGTPPQQDLQIDGYDIDHPESGDPTIYSLELANLATQATIKDPNDSTKTLLDTFSKDWYTAKVNSIPQDQDPFVTSLGIMGDDADADDRRALNGYAHTLSHLEALGNSAADALSLVNSGNFDPDDPTNADKLMSLVKGIEQTVKTLSPVAQNLVAPMIKALDGILNLDSGTSVTSTAFSYKLSSGTATFPPSLQGCVSINGVPLTSDQYGSQQDLPVGATVTITGPQNGTPIKLSLGDLSAMHDDSDLAKALKANSSGTSGFSTIISSLTQAQTLATSPAAGINQQISQTTSTIQARDNNTKTLLQLLINMINTIVNNSKTS